uniref:Uncharacterized protein n=1 Tax=Palpitomonas bilix TaxID=652834 RepID=A0A7S3D6A7_9EUKA|mmetsp:Transcript_21592/g.56069  ORF Transcript_21592/g.56069 Transcript_21592/m.56069 type:complete len:327 (+) Transcript_21592:179-1159(+)
MEDNVFRKEFSLPWLVSSPNGCTVGVFGRNKVTLAYVDEGEWKLTNEVNLHGVITAAAVADSGKCVVGTDQKSAMTIQRQGNTLLQVASCELEAKVFGAAIMEVDDRCDVYIMEKNDVLKVPFANVGQQAPEHILGHFGLMTRVLPLPRARKILTADRDEKIRCSELDRPFIVNRYYFGHTDAVEFAYSTADEKELVTVGAEGKLIAWNIEEGTLLCSASLYNGESGAGGRTDACAARCIGSDGLLIAVAQEGGSVLEVWLCEKGRLVLSSRHNLGVDDISGIAFLSNSKLLLTTKSNLLRSLSIEKEAQSCTAPPPQPFDRDEIF